MRLYGSPLSYDAVIIIFGVSHRPDGHIRNSMRHRVAKAVAVGHSLKKRGYKRILYMPTGGVTGKKYGHTQSEAESMRWLLEQYGVVSGDIFCENHALDTLDSIKICSGLLKNLCPAMNCFLLRDQALLNQENTCKIVLVSSGYHITRCLVLMWLLGWKCCGAWPAFPAAQNRCKRWYWRVREVPAFIYDVSLLCYEQFVQVIKSR